MNFLYANKKRATMIIMIYGAPRSVGANVVAKAQRRILGDVSHASDAGGLQRLFKHFFARVFFMQNQFYQHFPSKSNSIIKISDVPIKSIIT